MTLEGYAQEVGDALRDAHNNKDKVALTVKFQEADNLLAKNEISQAQQEAFWRSVRKAVFSGPWLMEKQANSSLVALMQAIEQGLAAREGK